MLTSIPDAAATPNEAARQAMQKVGEAFETGKMISAGDALDALLTASHQSLVYERVFALSRVHDMCLTAYDFTCERKVFDEMVAASNSVGALPDGDKRQIGAEMTERFVRRALVYADLKSLDQWLPILERFSNDAFGQDFARANLTLAEAYLLLDDQRRAAFFSRRGWFYLLSDTARSVDAFIDALPEFLSVLVGTGQAKRAITSLAIMRRTATGWNSVRPYAMLQFATADIQVQNALGNPKGVAVAAGRALEVIDSSEFQPLIKDYLAAKLVGARLVACIISRGAGCNTEAIASRGIDLLTAFTTRDVKFTHDPNFHTLAAILAFYAAAEAKDAPQVLRTVLESTRAALMPRQTKSSWITIAGKAFLVWHSNKQDSAALIRNATLGMLEEWRTLQAIGPLEAAPLSFEANLVLQTCLATLDRDPDHLSEQDQELVLLLATLAHREWRTVESQYAYAVSRLSAQGERASLQAYYSLELAIGREEHEALRGVVERALGDEVPVEKRHFDSERFLRFNRLVEFERQHRNALEQVRSSYKAPEHLLLELREVLRPGERFITHAVSFDRFVRICFGQKQFHVRATQTDFVKTLVSLKTILASLTNPSPPGSQVDGSFPFVETDEISRLVLGDGSECVGDAEHLVFAPDPMFYSVSLEVLLDPARKRAGTVRLEDAPWLGSSRAISIVTDVRQFIALRKAKRPDLAPFAFLGVGDPVFSNAPVHDHSTIAQARTTQDQLIIGLNNLEELPQTRSELEQMATLFGPSSHVLLGENATELNVRREELLNYRVISFATHGLLREDVAGLPEPALVLTPRDSRASLNDGLLTATEISALPLDADLVILSACSSAKFDPGQYIGQAAGLSTAFLIAGARSTLASMWPVDSEATASLMRGFGAEFVDDPKKGAALALRDSLKVFLGAKGPTGYKHPRFWAAFAVFGDGGREPVGPMRPMRSSLMQVTPRDSTITWGELQRSVALGNWLRLESGYEDTGKTRVRGLLRMVQGSRTMWLASEDQWSFMLPTREEPGLDPVVLAWRGDGQKSLQLEMRAYGLNGRMTLRKPIDVLGDTWPSGIVSGTNGEYIIVTYRTNKSEPGGSAAIRIVDRLGKTRTAKRVSLSPELDLPHVRVAASGAANGFWLAVEGTIPATSLLGPPFEAGARRTCMPAKRTDLLYFGSDLTYRGEPIHLKDISVSEIVPRDENDLAILTKYDSCVWVEQSTAGAALLAPEHVVQTYYVSGSGANYNGRVGLSLPDGGWLLISGVQRQLGPWKARSSFRSGPDYRPEWFARDLDANSQSGFSITRFDKDGAAKESQLHLIPGEMWIDDAFLESTRLTVLGARNYAHFEGEVSVH